MPATVTRPADPARPPRSLGPKAAIAAEVAFVAAIALVLFTSGGRSDPSRAVLALEFAIPPGDAPPAPVVRDRSREVKQLLGSAGLGDFAALQASSEHDCARADLEGVSDCTWVDKAGEKREGRFTVVDRELARLSEGGTGPRPRNPAEATAVVGAVLAGRNVSERPACTRMSGDRHAGRALPLPPGTYDCLLPGGGERGTLRWQWNPDGTVARETFGTPHRG